jgi:4-diphosphocytidyl-2C-methyl-D-erythritol kinase
MQNSMVEVNKIFTEGRWESLLFNAFQGQILDEHGEVAVLFSRLRRSNYYPCVSGSGSGCFILHRRYDALGEAQRIIFEQLGPIPLCEIVRFL